MTRKEAKVNFIHDYLTRLQEGVEYEHRFADHLKENNYEVGVVDHYYKRSLREAERFDAAMNFFKEEEKYKKQPRDPMKPFKPKFEDQYIDNLKKELHSLDLKLQDLYRLKDFDPSAPAMDMIDRFNEEKRVAKTRIEIAKDIIKKRDRYMTMNTSLGKMKLELVKFSDKVTGKELPQGTESRLQRRESVINRAAEAAKQLREDKDSMLQGTNLADEIRLGKKLELLSWLKEVDWSDNEIAGFDLTKTQQKVIDKSNAKRDDMLINARLSTRERQPMNEIIIKHEINVMEDISRTSETNKQLNVKEWQDRVLKNDCRFTKAKTPIAREATAKYLKDNKERGE